MTERVCVILDSWIIQDGNYGDFARGDRRPFALSFYPKELVPVQPWESSQPSFTHKGLGEYAVRGRRVFEARGWWVIDIGLLAYAEHAPAPSGAELVRGRLQLGIDPFSYFERLARTADAPALVYDWEIEKIERGARPLVVHASDQATMPSAAKPVDVERTDAWRDDGGRAAYLLHCRRLPGEPRWTLRP
ncbi:MAG TPA: hypothetical protein VD887_10310 [Allosphingosinicella sp.]|nr:hypothetical protein [Allosphingosinicella sp.]